ncbi:MAG: metallophosphoesterase [Oscillospiraceae bacterium]|jgi:hypothetical protein|nr:metallophosphoesterase [Oscillospiraceae bacterium]
MSDEFTPVLRFLVMSDTHYQDEPSPARERTEQGLRIGRRIAAAHPTYRRLDAVAVVGDFADRGSEAQYQAFHASLEQELTDETKRILSVASHEFNATVEVAYERLARIFGQPPDVHEVISGFHFISISPSSGTSYDGAKQAWAAGELAKAAADDPKRPIFFFQHPHVSDTVYGSIMWGDYDLTAILMNYPQVIDFSGHSHAPVNDPRSIHQDYFTCLGTGTMHYFELDEFDKYYGTHPPLCEQAGQMLIVEADAGNRVRVTPYDVLTDQPFPFVWSIDCPSDPDTFQYTNSKRRAAARPPFFPPEAKLTVHDVTSSGAALTFDQAAARQDYVNDYRVRVFREADGTIVRQLALWSGYYFSDMPETLSLDLTDLTPGTAYRVEILARGFWENVSENGLTGRFVTEN